MTLIATTHPDLLRLPKNEYIETIFDNEHIEWMDFSRQELDDFLKKITEQYGETILAEVGIRATKPEVPNVFDSVPRVENIKYLKGRGFYIVGLRCKFETQLKRSLGRKKEIDPADETPLRKQIESTDAYFQMDEMLKRADVVYNTDEVEANSPEILREIIEAAQ